jgi:hypothetical protein
MSLVFPALLAACSSSGGGDTSSADAAGPSLELLAGMVSAGAAGHVDGVGSEARFSGASDLAADGAGNVFVLEGQAGGNHDVRRISPQGVVTTVTSYGTDAAVELHGIAVDEAGNVYVGISTFCTDLTFICGGHGEIHRIDPSGARTPVEARSSSDGTATSFLAIRYLTRDRAGNFYVVDAFARRLRLDTEGDLTTLMGTSNTTILHLASVTAVDEAGAVYEPWIGDGEIGVAAIGNGALSQRLFPAQFAQGTALTDPRGLAIDSEHNFYVADAGRHVVRKLTASGTVSLIAGVDDRRGFVPGPLPGGLDTPRGIALRGSDLYVAMDTAIAVVRNRP